MGFKPENSVPFAGSLLVLFLVMRLMGWVNPIQRSENTQHISNFKHVFMTWVYGNITKSLLTLKVLTQGKWGCSSFFLLKHILWKILRKNYFEEKFTCWVLRGGSDIYEWFCSDLLPPWSRIGCRHKQSRQVPGRWILLLCLLHLQQCTSKPNWCLLLQSGRIPALGLACCGHGLMTTRFVILDVV